MILRKINDEVYVAEDSIVTIGPSEIAFVKEKARTSTRRRARICAHRSNSDALHEMVIALQSESYIRPHRHVGKVESFHVIEGTVDVVVFDDHGAIVNVVELGDLSTGRNVYYRLSDSRFHTLLIHGDQLVIHEVTNGPFDPALTLLAPFAPDENSTDEAHRFIMRVRELASQFVARARSGVRS
jgi:cupin fold WbuC family metalloprotein